MACSAAVHKVARDFVGKSAQKSRKALSSFQPSIGEMSADAKKSFCDSLYKLESPAAEDATAVQQPNPYLVRVFLLLCNEHRDAFTVCMSA